MSGVTPGIISGPRLTTLAASLLVSLGSGTNYVYSAWAPQLGSQLRITHTQLNIIGLAGNVGVYSFGPIWGRIVDTRGPRIPLIGAFFLLIGGYFGIKHFFDAGVPKGASTIPAFTFLLVVLCNFMTGAGGNGGLTSSVNSTAKSFPDKARATATGLVISGFGLSAFLFSTISHVIYAGNTSDFLRLLAIGTSLPMVAGFFLVRQVPLPPSDDIVGVEGGIGEALGSTTALIDDSRVRLLDREDMEAELDDTCSSEQLHGDPVGGGPSSSDSASTFTRFSSEGVDDDLPNIFGAELWKSGDFWLLFVLLSILAGTGLMYINNVGTMSQTLYVKKYPRYDDVEAAKWQSVQVSAISVMSFSGRILIGIISDTAKNTFKLPRSYCLVLVSIGIFLSQITAAHIDEIGSLWLPSSILGISYGSTFSLFPQVCIEWFGLPHFSENWGYLSLAPMVAGNLFMIYFGHNLDAHGANSHSQIAAPRTSSNSRDISSTFSLDVLMRKAAEILPSSGEMPQCLEGKQCYVAALHLTSVMTFGCILLSICAAWRDRRKLSDDKRRSPSGRRNARRSAERLRGDI